MNDKTIIDGFELGHEPEPVEPAEQPSQRGFDKLLTSLVVTLAIPLLTISVLGMMRNVSGIPIIALSSLIVLLGMFVLYLYAYSFYDDRFYVLIAIGWFVNAAYISCEGFADATIADKRWTFVIFALAQLYEVPFYIAAFIVPNTKISTRRLSIELSIWSVLFGASFYLEHLITPIALEHGEVTAVPVFIAILYSMTALIRVGLAFRKRLRRDVHGAWTLLLPLTFYIYAGIQPLYLLKPLRVVLLAAFMVALLSKVSNSIGVFGVMLRDVGTLKQRLEIMQMWQDLGILTFAVEHDIKNPLQVISDNLMMMEQRYQANQDVINRISKIRREMLRIFSTTEIIRTLRGGRRFYERLMQKTSVSSLFNRSIEAVKKELPSAHIRFIQEDQLVYVKAYPPQLQQVFVNILRNAIEAIREEQPGRPTVRVKYELLPDKRVAIRVSDNGCGMPAAAIPQLGKFYSTKRDLKANSGIGLYVSSRILGFHDGHFEWSSSLHKGTEVSIVLPVWSTNS